MRCSRAQKYISEYVDGSLETKKSAALERHIETCHACREVLSDFRAMTAAASKLESPVPDKAVWLKLKARLTAAETKPAVAMDRAPWRRWAFGWSTPALKFATAAALALLLVGSGIYVGVRLGNRGTAAYLKNSEKYTLAKLDEAEGYYKKAIQSLSEALAAQKGMMVPQVADMFEKNLAVIDATIQACRTAVLKGPDDLQARNYLLAAYMDKVSFLDTALDFTRKNADAGPRGKSL
jgi:anti-sigma-K factor RskA